MRGTFPVTGCAPAVSGALTRARTTASNLKYINQPGYAATRRFFLLCVERGAHRRPPLSWRTSVCRTKLKRGILERLQYGVHARLVTRALRLKPREYLRIDAKRDGLLRFNGLQTLAYDDPGDVFDSQLGMLLTSRSFMDLTRLQSVLEALEEEAFFMSSRSPKRDHVNAFAGLQVYDRNGNPV